MFTDLFNSISEAVERGEMTEAQAAEWRAEAAEYELENGRPERTSSAAGLATRLRHPTGTPPAVLLLAAYLPGNGAEQSESDSQARYARSARTLASLPLSEKLARSVPAGRALSLDPLPF